MATTLLGIQHQNVPNQTVVIDMPISHAERELIRVVTEMSTTNGPRMQKVRLSVI